MNNMINKNERPWLLNYDDHVSPSIDYPNVTLNDLVTSAGKTYAQKTFISYNEEEFSYHLILEKKGLFEKNLCALGVRKGDRVALILPNIPQFVIAYFAILAIGAIVVAINPRYTETEIEVLFKQAAPTTVICLRSFQDIVHSLSERFKIENVITTELSDYQSIKKDQLMGNEVKFKRNKLDFIRLFSKEISYQPTDGEKVNAEDPAIFQFSGGTTGTPKPAVGLHRNIVANAFQFSKWCDLKNGEEVILAAIPLYHVYGMVLAMNMGVAIGAKIILISDPTNVDNILEKIEKNKVTFYPGVPTMYFAINQNEKAANRRTKLDSIKACISGSFTLHTQIKRDFEHLTDGKLMEGYGLSEAPTATHCNPLKGKNKAGSIGMPLPGVDARIVDLENGKIILPVGQIGELIIKGPQVMSRYYRLPIETNEAIRDGWLFTGDIARMDEDGYFFLIDRKKSLIKVNGLQVWPNEVEAVVQAHPAIKECGVGGIPDMAHGEKVVCWVVPERNASLNHQEVIEWCKTELTGYKIPSEIICIEKIPRTSVGKILRRNLIANYKENEG